MIEEKSVDNTLLSNGVIIDDMFYPKKNLPSGTLRIILTIVFLLRISFVSADD